MAQAGDLPGDGTLCTEICASYAYGRIQIYLCISLDPDVPCYGPDAVDEPYVYSFERDEPLRNRNMQILEKLGYQEYDVDFGEVGADGAKHRFAWKSEMVAAEEAGQA